jgi:hypothetical protein
VICLRKTDEEQKLRPIRRAFPREKVQLLTEIVVAEGGHESGACTGNRSSRSEQEQVQKSFENYYLIFKI